MDIFGEFDTPAGEVKKTSADTMTHAQDPLLLTLSDDIIIHVIDSRVRASKSYFDSEYNLTERRRKNKQYLVGNQINEKKLKYYNARYVDNIVYEAEGTIKPIALSRLPDLLIKPGNDTDESKETAKQLTGIVNSDIRKKENRRVLSLGFKHLPVYLTGVLKAVWDPKSGDDGDYKFRTVHPENIIVDHTSASNDVVDMDFVAEASERSIKELCMQFPNKKEELLMLEGIPIDNPDETRMASKIKIWEIWFKWYKETRDSETNKSKWETIYGVAWKYKTLVLGKMKHPYWDWQGKKRLFKYDISGNKEELTEEEIRRLLFGEEMETEQETYYHNHFKDPQFPYYFMGYEQWGDSPIDMTSRIEQVLYMQDNINKRGRQITEMNDRAKGKHVFSSESGLTKQEVEAMDMDNPDEDVMVKGRVSDVHGFIQGTPAPAQLYQEQELERNKAFAKMGTHATTRGEKKAGPEETATGMQIMRESDFGRIDDIVEETINPAAEWMANWAMQFIKIFYTKTHMRKLLGKDGEITFAKINRDLIEDGIEVVVSASGVDKMERKREAFERAKLKLTDPLTFFQDTDAPDPKGRAEKLMTFLLSPELYMQKYLINRDIQQMAQLLSPQPQGGQVAPSVPVQGGEQTSPTGNATQAGAGGGAIWPPSG